MRLSRKPLRINSWSRPVETPEVENLKGSRPAFDVETRNGFESREVVGLRGDAALATKDLEGSSDIAEIREGDVLGFAEIH